MDFLCNRRIYAFTTAVTLFFFSIFLGYAAFLSGIESVPFHKAFYFLTIESESVEVGAWDTQLKGGAGYTIDDEGTLKVALSVYLAQEDGQAILSAFENTDTQVFLVTKQIHRLYFKTREQKRNKGHYLAALHSLYSGMEALEKMIVSLDKGGTQESAKRALAQIRIVMEYCAKTYDRVFPSYANVCKVASERLESYDSKTIYAKDLRYELCDLAVKYIKIASIFAL